MQVTDTLAAGGLERVAVNLANCLPRDQFRSFLCATRDEGPLKALISPQVEQCYLNRRGNLGFVKDARRLADYIEKNEIKLLHAHGTSLFLCAAATCFAPRTRLLWHDHFGRSDTEERPRWLYRLAAKRLQGVVAVNENLAEWSRQRLGVPSERVWYVPNFVCEPQDLAPAVDLPGTSGRRIACVANLRPQKDHLTLLGAMKLVARKLPEAHLFLIGGGTDATYRALVEKTIASENLKVTWLGQRNDVDSILKSCDLGVLSSASEGLPLALIEYGMAGLACVATDVGKCSEVLDQGRVGRLVPPHNPALLASAIVALLKAPGERAVLGRQFQRRVREAYSERSIIKRICEIYSTIS